MMEEKMGYGTFAALLDVGAEVCRARTKFPDNRHLLAALAEEVGELAKDLLERGNGPGSRAEAMQVACVAVRIMVEGDSDYGIDDPLARSVAVKQAVKQAVASVTKEVSATAAPKPKKVKKASGPVVGATTEPKMEKYCGVCGEVYAAKRKDQTNCLGPECRRVMAQSKKKDWDTKRAAKVSGPAVVAAAEPARPDDSLANRRARIARIAQAMR